MKQVPRSIPAKRDAAGRYFLKRIVKTSTIEPFPERIILPYQILKSTKNKYTYKKIANLKPIILDPLIKYIDFKGGYHLPISDKLI